MKGLRSSQRHGNRHDKPRHYGGEIAGEGRIFHAGRCYADGAVILMRCYQPRKQSRAQSSDCAGGGTRSRLPPPSNRKGGRKHGAPNQEAHYKKEPAKIDADGVPDAGEEGHGKAKDADHDVGDKDELFGRGRRFEVCFVDVEG